MSYKKTAMINFMCQLTRAMVSIYVVKCYSGYFWENVLDEINILNWWPLRKADYSP